MSRTIPNIEVCIDSVQSAVNAENGKASRVELCDNLIEGGTTPSSGMIAAVLERIWQIYFLVGYDKTKVLFHLKFKISDETSNIPNSN
ncbi:hypothetical protein RclHR1_01710016 [Rhizophagus clarus]|uniref:Copper homeostasis protein cutC homolog n=1 Tax=Rhizophagus clarus TaxID=94130 RepID=A0A2Z6RBZ0_9GLOM|nr:hypothetical protein RclHR1_01710016 [Rhizophagus clarus]